MKIRFLIIYFSFLFAASFLEAHKPYQATIAVPPVSSHASATNLVNLKRNIQTAFIELQPFYTPTSAAVINIDLRGIQNITAFAANSTSLVVVIPQANIVETFDGGTRDASLSLYKDFIRDAAHGNLLKPYARYSPIDPIAGNPTSLMAQMGQSDYFLGHLSPLSGCECWWGAQSIRHQFQSGVNVERAFVGGFDTTLVTAPLRYSYSPDREWGLIVDAPLAFISNGGAYSIYGSLGMGLRAPITSFWSLTPILRFGFGGSLDLCTSGAFLSAGLTSVLNYKFNSVVVSMTNYAAYVTSTNLWLSGINFNYHLQNYVFKNGLSVATCDAWQFLKRPVNFNAFFIDSYYAREHLYIRHFDEIGLSMIVNKVNPCLDYDCAVLGFSYQFGEHHFRGYKFNIDYQF